MDFGIDVLNVWVFFLNLILYTKDKKKKFRMSTYPQNLLLGAFNFTLQASELLSVDTLDLIQQTFHRFRDKTPAVHLQNRIGVSVHLHLN